MRLTPSFVVRAALFALPLCLLTQLASPARVAAAGQSSQTPAARQGSASQGNIPQDDASAKNAKQARTALDAMVKALGGDAWLNMKNREMQGQTAAFYHGKPSSGTTLYFEIHEWPDHDRVEFTKHRDVVQIYAGREGWEILYNGKKELPKEQVDDFLRRRDHSIEMVVKTWLKDPNSILIYEGQKLAERHLAEQVTVISAQNEAVTIQMDTQTHLPLSRSFQWRDPLYKDKNEDAEEYDNYRPVDGFPTPFNVTRYKNGDMVNQRFLLKAIYNQTLPADEFNVDAVAIKIKNK
jgi:hypothetical protein